MSDNTTYTEGSGITIATDDIGGIHHQRMKMEQGSDGTAADIAPTSPMAVRPGHPSTGYLTNAAVNVTGAGDQTLVSATASQTTRVFRLFLVAAGVTNITIKTGSTSLSGVIPLTPNQGFVLDFDGEPWFVTGSNEAFVINVSAAVDVDGFIQYEKTA